MLGVGIFLIAILSNCMQQNVDQFSYFDGSGNGYTIHNKDFKYKPVTPERSSSGTYSGGKPVSRLLTEEELANALKLFQNAISAKDEHQDDRAMLTGLVVVSTGADTTRIVLRPGSPKKIELENFLLKLKSK